MSKNFATGRRTIRYNDSGVSDPKRRPSCRGGPYNTVRKVCKEDSHRLSLTHCLR
jgi:hypothetical protein